MAEPFQQRLNEKRLYEDLVNMIVDIVHKEFSNNMSARIRVYKMVAENFDGLARSLQPPEVNEANLIDIIKNGDAANYE